MRLPWFIRDVHNVKENNFNLGVCVCVCVCVCGGGGGGNNSVFAILNIFSSVSEILSVVISS